MSSLSLNKEVRNGVEYWVSPDGSQVGMSMRGIAVLAGVSPSAIQPILQAFQAFSKLPSKRLEALRQAGLRCSDVSVSKEDGQRITFVPAEICIAIIDYYAFEATRTSEKSKEIALENYQNIATVGMKVYILHEVGYKLAAPQQPDVSAVLTDVLASMNEIKFLATHYVNIQDNLINKPGLAHILNTYEKGYVLSDGKMFTVKEWLEAKNLKLSFGQRCSLGRAIHGVFKTHGGKEAPTYKHARVYSTEDVPMLESALKSLKF